MIFNTKQKLDLHRQFWRGETCDHLLASFRIGDYFFADKFAAARELLVPGRIITPDMIQPERFLADYERMYQETEDIEQSGFFTAEPFIGLPWFEAILGCPVIASDKSFITEPCMKNTCQFPLQFKLDNNEWFNKFLEFTKSLVQLSAGRFPVAQPILRGLSDAFGAIFGQAEMIYHLYDSPEASRQIISAIARVFQETVGRQFEIIPEFNGGYSIGFYHVWTPGKCIWFQEDLSSILSPELFKEFIQEEWQNICGKYDYNAIHLHPSSFQNLDLILAIENLKAVEINKDGEGPVILELLPVFQKVLDSGKRLIIWGNLDKEEVWLIKQNFPGQPIFLSIVARDIQTAKSLNNLIN